MGPKSMLTCTEEWILDRVQLKNNNLEDVRSLSLPGTYHEKIQSVGTSLRSFFRLKHLDLSRNALDTIQGLEGLKLLEKLNLYYNNVGSLSELYRLRHNQQLQELDLRLNPVARNEPDYRLFLIHMLPSLRRLDDRAVRDTERKAALLHFSSEQAAQLAPHQKPAFDQQETKQPNPRVEHVKSLAKPPGVLDDDDVAILEFLVAAGKDLDGDAKLSSGSTARTPQAIHYSPDSIRVMDNVGLGLGDAPVTKAFETRATKPTLPYGESTVKRDGGKEVLSEPDNSDVSEGNLESKYPNLAALPAARFSDTSQQAQSGTTLKNRTHYPEDENLRFQDEIDAYTAYKATGHFTPCPVGDASSDGNQETAVKEKDPQTAERPSKPAVKRAVPQEREKRPVCKSETTKDQVEVEASVPPQGTLGAVIFKISDLVDKYWNGAKSLIHNPRFTARLSDILHENMESVKPGSGKTMKPGTSESTSEGLRIQVQRLKWQLKELNEENKRLHRQITASSAHSSESTDRPKSKASNGRQQSPLEAAMGANRYLDECLRDGPGTFSQPRPQDTLDSSQIAQLTAENARLKGELSNVSAQLKHMDQMHNMAAMLQQSHQSLLKTNEHLMTEMESLRQGQGGARRPLNDTSHHISNLHIPSPASQWAGLIRKNVVKP